MYDVIKGDDLPCAGQTIAEGIAVKQPGELTRAIVEPNGDGHFPGRRGRRSNTPSP